LLAIIDTLAFILAHPLNRGRPLAALNRYFHWQLTSRLRDETIIDWVDGAVLAVKPGMQGATGNVYCGLHEFVEMAFLLHFLRPGDLFLDIGANVGTYAVLASKVCGARSIAFEPDPVTGRALSRNIQLNGLQDLVTVQQVALGSRTGNIAFTVGLDTINRIATENDDRVQTVPIKRLDDIPDAQTAVLAKLDVEGFEEEVLSGSRTVLSSPGLLAIQSESNTPAVSALLVSFGFEQMFYDPFSRELAPMPFGYRTSNALYVRDVAAVRKRIDEAPSRAVLGRLI
jgi:FkbM family methyltransferase